MALTFQQWAKAKGIKQSPAAFQGYMKSGHYKPAPPPPAPQQNVPAPQATAPPVEQSPVPPPPSPAYAWGELDASGTDEMSALDRWRQGLIGKDGAKGTIDADYDIGVGEQNAARIQASRMLANSTRDVTNNAAARGALRSGIREFNQGEVVADDLQRQGGINRAIEGLSNTRQRALNQTNADYERQQGAIKTGAAGRLYEQAMARYRQRYGGV